MYELSFPRKNVLILGMGISGRSAAQFLLVHGASVWGIDRNSDVIADHPDIQELKKLGLNLCVEKDVQDLCRFDFMVLSPGIPLTHPLVQSARSMQLPVMGEIELGARIAKSSILGITGTNGKTTLTMLVNHVLSECGHQAKALGNVGIPFTRELLNLHSESEKLTTTIVLELSSYQIETLYSPCLETAIILNVTPDHLDRYRTMEAYAQAKFEIGRALKPGGNLYIEEQTWRRYQHLLRGGEPRIYGYGDNCYIYTDLNSIFREGKKAFDLPLKLRNKKSHELENMLAAYALCADKGIAASSFIGALETFKKPAHRLEFIVEQDGIRYYDDSKGTNIDAVIRAVQVLEGSIVLIAGGVDKGSAYTPWIEEFKGKVKLICAIGQAAGKIGEQLGAQLPVIIFNSLDEAVHQASRFAQKGDIVLLSPGCSSFDMFKDYAHRGNEFQRIVRELV